MYVALTMKSGGSMSFFINGELIGISSFKVVIPTYLTYNFIGSSTNGFIGYVDEFQIWT